MGEGTRRGRASAAFLAALAGGLLACGGDDGGRADDAGGGDPGTDETTEADAGSDAEADAAEAPGDGDGDADAAHSAYGVFQLYGDEYQPFRTAMGFTLDDYWAFVDGHVARLGVTFTRTNTLLIWGLVQPVLGGPYDWNGARLADDVLRATFRSAPGKVMDILVVLEPSRSAPTEPPFPTGLEAQYQQFVRDAVERYDGDGAGDVDPGVRVRSWQVMNEPVANLEGLGRGPLTAAEYAELVRLTAEAARQADPQARVVLGEVGLHLRDVLPLLSPDVRLEAIDLHFWNMGPSAAYESPGIGAIRAALDAAGRSETEIWMCEFGTYVNQPGSTPVHTAEDQARWLVKAMVAQRAAGVTRILWNNLVAWVNFDGNPDSPFNFMGLVSTGEASGDGAADLGRERVAYYAYQRLIAETETRVAVLAGEVAGLADPLRGFEFRPLAGGEPFFVVWSDGAPATAALSTPLARARIVDLVPDATGVFTETVVDAVAGQVLVEAGADPLLVRPVT